MNEHKTRAIKQRNAKKIVAIFYGGVNPKMIIFDNSLFARMFDSPETIKPGYIRLMQNNTLELQGLNKEGESWYVRQKKGYLQFLTDNFRNG